MMTSMSHQNPNQLAPKRSVRSTHVPQRRCAGCGKSGTKSDLVRVVLTGENVVVDLGGRTFGRGAWVHPRSECLRDGVKRGFAKSFHSRVATTLEELSAQLVASANRRARAILISARRAGQLAIGAEAVKKMTREHPDNMIVVACDAMATARIPEVERAINTGRAVAWGSKATLGEALQRSEVAVVGIWDAGFCGAFTLAVTVAGLQGSTARKGIEGQSESLESCMEVE